MDRTQTFDLQNGDARETLPLSHGMVSSKGRTHFVWVLTLLAGALAVVVFGALTLLLLLLALTEPIG